MNILGCRWVFLVKLNADGSLNKLKARFVANEFNQEEGIVFVETYSPVVHTSKICIVLIVGTSMNWKITQLDAKNVFLHGDLLYMNKCLWFSLLALKMLLVHHMSALSRRSYMVSNTPPESCLINLVEIFISLASNVATLSLTLYLPS